MLNRAYAIGGAIGLIVGGVAGFIFGRYAGEKNLANLVEERPRDWWEDASEDEDEDILEDEDEDILEDEEVEIRTAIDLEKPDLAELNRVLVEYYPPETNEKQDGIIKELDAHICTADEYMYDYPEYDQNTCSWYPEEGRLVNLDRDFEVYTDIERTVGKVAAKAIFEDSWEDESIFVVNHELGVKLEILKETDSSYEEDLNDWMERNS